MAPSQTSEAAAATVFACVAPEPLVAPLAASMAAAAKLVLAGPAQIEELSAAPSVAS